MEEKNKIDSKAAEKFLSQKEDDSRIEYTKNVFDEGNKLDEPKKESIEKVTSLGKKSDHLQIERNIEKSEIQSRLGWHLLDHTDFPSRGLFYPLGTKFTIRAAEGREIRHYATLDESDPYSVDQSLNDILGSCLNVNFGDRIASWKDLKEEDRIYVILAIKELTFAKGENKLVFKVNCFDCENEVEMEIKNSNLDRNIPDEKIMKYYNEELRRFDVQTKNYGIIQLSPPSVGVMQIVTKYIKEKQLENKKVDNDFIKIVPYLLEDWRGINFKTIENLHVEYIRWTSDKTRFSLMYNLVDMVKVSVKETMHTTCKHCGAEVTAPMQFPGGIKSIFIISDISGELL